jgi:hypothetical protein
VLTRDRRYRDARRKRLLEILLRSSRLLVRPAPQPRPVPPSSVHLSFRWTPNLIKCGLTGGHQITLTPDLAVAVDTIVEARTVYLLGQLRSAPVVDLLRYVLTMVGKRCVLLDAGGGLATHMARLIGSGDVLVAVSFRFYATEVVNIVEETGKRGVPIAAISDSTLSPLAKYSRVLFPVPEHDYTFSRSLAAPIASASAGHRSCGAASTR